MPEIHTSRPSPPALAYVAAQDADDPGALVLSRFAGAACELGEVLLANPYDVDGMAVAIATAADMPLAERASTMRR